MRILLPLLVVAAAVHAQPVVRTSIDMMPGLEQPARGKLYRAFYGAQGQVNRINQRLRQIAAALKKKPAPPEAQKLRAERASLQKRIPPLYAEMFKRFREAGLDAAAIQRLRRMPRGVLHQERYNHGVVLEAPDLTAAQRALIERCVASVDAAQRILHVQHKYLGGVMKELDPTLRRQFDGSFYNQRQQMERRFWKMIYYALTPKQMVAVRALLSNRYRNIPQLDQQMYLLPGMSASQANRIRARFTEHESEVAADRAEQRRLSRKLRDKSLSKPDRQKFQVEVRDCNQRLYALNARFRDDLRAAVSTDQLEALRSLAPMMNVGERYQGLRPILQQMSLDPAQSRTVAEMRRAMQKEQRKIRSEAGREMAGMRGADLGPESPQQMTMQMAQRRATSKSLAMVRARGRRVLLEVLEPDQVVNWVIAPGLKP